MHLEPNYINRVAMHFIPFKQRVQITASALDTALYGVYSTGYSTVWCSQHWIQHCILDPELDKVLQSGYGPGYSTAAAAAIICLVFQLFPSKLLER
jgi:hypothetical protein